MNYNEFVPAAIRTESQVDTVNVDKKSFNGLIASSLRIADNLDLIKKNVFYGKDIDMDRYYANIDKALDEIKNAIPTVKLKSTAEPVKINPRVFHGVLGVVTEALELAELLDLDQDYPERVKIADELGDLNWYSAILCDEMDLDMEEEVLAGVIAKLRERFPDKFESALAITRDKSSEMEATKAVVNN